MDPADVELPPELVGTMMTSDMTMQEAANRLAAAMRQKGYGVYRNRGRWQVYAETTHGRLEVLPALETTYEHQAWLAAAMHAATNR